MTKENFLIAMTYLGKVYRIDFDETEVALWYDFFGTTKFEVFKEAIQIAIKKTKFPPKIPDMLEFIEEADAKVKFNILEIMRKDGYFKRGYVELDANQELRNYDKATKWLSTGIIPEWFKQDMALYEQKSLSGPEAKKIENKKLLGGN
jgi:hypothetical protein